MNIAFYAPMKSPNHPVPSGDRLMGRLLMKVLSRIVPPENVRLASEFRAYSSKPSNTQLQSSRAEALQEASAILENWRQENWRPDVWLSYHPYYKSPDWIGPEVARQLGCPIVTAEASFSPKRASDEWACWHQQHAEGLRQASCHLYLKDKDRVGLLALPATQEQLVHLPPFIDTEPFSSINAVRKKRGATMKLITVAMMRADVKLKSYRYLAEALAGLGDIDWSLDIVGDGAARGDVEAAFAGPLAGRIHWHGQVAPEAVPTLLADADIYVWPGFEEAYGLAYLEAQACGLPVVAQDSAGVPEVVRSGETGLLAPENDLGAFQAALRRLMTDRDQTYQLGQRARQFVHAERSLTQAQSTIGRTLQQVLANPTSHQS